MKNNAEQSLYDLLITQNLEPEILDSAGKPVTDPSKAELFSFDYTTENQDYGTVVILIGDNNQLEVYFGDNLGRSMEADDKSGWYDFLHQLKSFASRNMMTFGLNNIARLKYTMKGMAAIKEGLFEGYYGRKNISYSDQPKQVRLMIKHNRNIDEGEARYRAIESLFVETAQGERFKLPFRNLMGGRIMARHVSEGGTPYDAFGQHIVEVISEIGTLSRFIRATRGKKFTGHTDELIEAAIRHYGDLKDKAKRMISQRGYLQERDVFDPAEISEVSATTDAIRDLFVEQAIDQRIEEALPIIAQLVNKKEDKMREANEFESWANQVMEGTWALPDTPEADAKLKELMSKPLIVGADATNATEQLYDLVGDDVLFDRLNDLADQDPNANCWDDEEVVNRLGELGIDINPTVNDMAQDAEYDAEKMNEDEDHSPVASAITRRILMQRPDLLEKFGPVAVTQAIDDVADFVGDVEEIGSSDVSGWIRQVEQSLGGVNEGDLNLMRKRAGIQQDVEEVNEGLDPAKQQRLDDLIDQYKYATDPIGYDDDAPDPAEVINQIRQEFGDKIADTIEQGPSSHFPRDNHVRGYDPLDSYGSSPRVTKAGKVNRQDISTLKSRLQQRAGGHTDPALPEGMLDTVKKVGSRVFDKLGGGSDEELLNKLRKDAGLPPRMAVPNKKGVGEDLDTDGVMMTRPSNMSS